MTTTKQDYEQVRGYREGATYHRMDLHTHTPASECSSFTLPAVMEAVFPVKPKSKTKAYREECHAFLQGLRGAGAKKFVEAYAHPELAKRPRLAPRRPLTAPAIKQIARAWADDIEQGEDRDDCVKRGLSDLRCYLASFFFPEEFVIRCYIEELHLVALTDHNHPGFLVPRLPDLGTWFGTLSAVNDHYREDIDRADPPGERVREVILARLALANERLGRAGGFEEAAHIDTKTSGNHPDKGGRKWNREAHIDQRIAHWADPENRPRKLHLFPGTEITVSDVHLLTIFPPEWFVPGRIGGILRAIGIPEEQWGRGFYAAATASVQDTIDAVHAEGGISIPAHANSDHKGLLRLFQKGLALERVLTHPSLLALETTGGSVLRGSGKKKSKDACNTLKWIDSQLKERDRTKPLSFVKNSDAHECRIELDGCGSDLGERFTYVKLDFRRSDTPDEQFRALRLALISGQSRMVENPVEDGYSYHPLKPSQYRVARKSRWKLVGNERSRPVIIGLTVAGDRSYADGLKLRFNPFLNCVVGSGGKATLVRNVGYAFGAIGFWARSSPEWLPGLVRVYWHDARGVHCLEREGRCADPHDAALAVRWLTLDAGGVFQLTAESPAGTEESDEIRALANTVSIWPAADLWRYGGRDMGTEDDMIKALVRALEFDDSSKAGEDEARPLLINQPRDVFRQAELFQQVLAAPYLKGRQVLWCTGSPNVPTALDAEKILITEEQSRGSRRWMELTCGGDFHEDEIRDRFLNVFEGGWLGFRRRSHLYFS